MYVCIMFVSIYPDVTSVGINHHLFADNKQLFTAVAVTHRRQIFPPGHLPPGHFPTRTFSPVHFC